jgi:membrane protein DedA with SNARE-associated domain
MVTTAAAFAASLGYLNIKAIFALAVLGNVVGDIIHYYLGNLLRNTIIEKYMKYFRIKKGLVKKLDDKIHNNLVKSMILIKSTPPLSTIGLLLIGASRAKFLKFLLISLCTVLPLALFYTVLGFYFGFAIKTVLEYFKMGQYVLFFVVVVCVIVFFLYKLISKKAIERLDN